MMQIDSQHSRSFPRLAGNGWRVEGGKWVEGGGWQLEGGGW